MLSFHHIGIPVKKELIKSNARYSPLYRMYTQNCENNFGLRIQYHTFEETSSLDKRIQTNVHIAFKVKNIEDKIKEQQILMPLYEPFKGYKCTIILVNNILIELIETDLSEEKIWNDKRTLQNGVLYRGSEL